VRFRDLRAGVEISQRSRHPLDPVQGAGRKTQLIHHGAKLPSLRRRQPAQLLHLGRTQAAIEFAAARHLQGPTVSHLNFSALPGRP
jgi:hypothetical protein